MKQTNVRKVERFFATPRFRSLEDRWKPKTFTAQNAISNEFQSARIRKLWIQMWRNGWYAHIQVWWTILDGKYQVGATKMPDFWGVASAQSLVGIEYVPHFFYIYLRLAHAFIIENPHRSSVVLLFCGVLRDGSEEKENLGIRQIILDESNALIPQWNNNCREIL